MLAEGFTDIDLNASSRRRAIFISGQRDRETSSLRSCINKKTIGISIEQTIICADSKNSARAKTICQNLEARTKR